MWRKILIASIVLFLILLFYSIISYSTDKKPTNWVYTFSEYSTQPFNTRIFFKELTSFFPGKEVEKLTENDFYSYFRHDFEEVNELSGDSLFKTKLDSLPQYISEIAFDEIRFNYIAVNNNFYSSFYGTDALINHIFLGGHAQIHAFYFGSDLQERLGINVQRLSNDLGSEPIQSTENITTWQGEVIPVRRTHSNHYFDDFSPSFDTLLVNDSGFVKGIRVQIGKGSISLFTLPHLYTNYDILYQDRTLSTKLLNELPVQNTIWSKSLNGEADKDRGLLYFIFSHPTLKWAYYILLFSIILFFLLNLQRRQRAIPIVKAPKNLSLSFLQTISDLHYARLDYHTVLKKKMYFLKNQIKQDFNLTQTKIDNQFIESLSKRSGIDEKLIRKLYRLYDETLEQSYITKHEFKSLCNLFQLFKK